MVGKQFDRSDVNETHNPGKSVSRGRSNVGSQPIQPLKISAFSKRREVPVKDTHTDTVLASAKNSDSTVAPHAPALASKTIELGKSGKPTKSAKLAKSTKAKASRPAYRLPPVDLFNLQRTIVQQCLVPTLKSKMLRMSIAWLGAVAAIGSATGLAFLWLASPPPPTDCQTVTLQSPEAHRLYCAQEKANSGKLDDLVAGMKLLQQWTPEQPLYREARQAIDDWSALVLLSARGRMAKGDVKQAIEAANQIPAASEVYLEAQEEIAQWRQEWQHGDVIYAKAQEAIKAQNWKLASQQVLELGYLNHEYWRIQQADGLSKQIVVEKQARISLTQAQKVAKGGTPEVLGQALALVKQIPSNTYASPEAQTVLQQWSQTLINVGLQQWRDGDRPGAMATALQIPLNPSLPSEGRDLIQFSQAQTLANKSLTSTQTEPTWSEIWSLLEALAAIQQIAPESIFYADAQAEREIWQAQLEDLKQLGLAHLTASLNDRSALQFAIAQANLIRVDRPRSTQAQTLIAQWNQKIQQLDDQPYLARAQNWAASGQIPDLRTAIAQANQIPTDRAAWQQAQGLIAQWYQQIQTIEDQPILDKAQALAKQGKLNEAIAVAEKIQPNRALYNQAQTGINDWKNKLRDAEIAADQPILDRAYGLAARQRLTMAIEVASQIAPDRALYDEAQAAIDIWTDERDSIWQVWADDPSLIEEANSDAPEEDYNEPGSSE
ncbi:MAG: hypothetical protein HC769_33585 [Cyanobacteria bacterium CRU_2_1]|nr:hypothetical protein [Cyanobacteria bacterium RU_5_0]NJR63278.1 hypothetical protein [Cyanobacteria bacterium CRU_2_1]